MSPINSSTVIISFWTCTYTLNQYVNYVYCTHSLPLKMYQPSKLVSYMTSHYRIGWLPATVLTVCLKPTAVCWGAFRIACNKFLCASEYSNCIALIRPKSEQNSILRQTLNHRCLNQTCKDNKSTANETHLNSTEIAPTRCLMRFQETSISTPTYLLDRTSCRASNFLIVN